METTAQSTQTFSIDLDETYYQYGREDVAPITHYLWTLGDFALRSSIAEIDTKSFLIPKIIDLFDDVKGVAAVYIERVERQINGTVLLTGMTYDEDLLNDLLEKEWQLQEDLPSLNIDFHYVPLLGRKREDCVSAFAELVWETS